jgi:CheY-like chemotaxis protein
MTSMPPTPSAHPPGSGPGAPSHGSASVLVIDDSLTILKVVETILEANGYQVTTARDGQEGIEQLSQRGPFDLVLLDFVMPRMNGYQFCRALRADEVHKDLPVVLMSARTSTIGDRFVEQTGAVDALNKPFDARALVAVVGAVLAKGKDSSRNLPSPDQMVDEAELDQEPDSMPPPSRHFRGLDVIAATLSKALTPHLRPSDLGSEAKLQRAVAKALEGNTLAAVATAMDMVDLGSSEEILRGELDRMPLAEILQLLQLRRQTGVIDVRHNRAGLKLFIKEGTLSLAQSTGTNDEYRVGRYFVEAGWMTREEVEEAVAACPSDQLIGQFLLEQDKIEAPQLHHALGQQSAELVYEVLRWPEGRFVLLDEPFAPEAESAQLYLGLSELVLEGFRRVDEWRLMADTIDFEAVLAVDQVALGTLDGNKIGVKERPVLDAIDGERTAREVMETSELASFDAIKAIYGLLQARVIRTVKAKPSKTDVADPGTDDGLPKVASGPSPEGALTTPAPKAPVPAAPAGSKKIGPTKPTGSRFSPTQPSASSPQPKATQPGGTGSGGTGSTSGSSPGKSAPGESDAGKSSPGSSSPSKSSPSGAAKSAPGKSGPGSSSLTKSSPGKSSPDVSKGPGKTAPSGSSPGNSTAAEGSTAGGSAGG